VGCAHRSREDLAVLLRKSSGHGLASGQFDHLVGRIQRKSLRGQGRNPRSRPEPLAEGHALQPLSGQPDQPENYHTLTYELAERDGGTHVSLTQDNNGSEEEAEHAKANWDAMLGGLKKTVEGG